MGPLRYGSLILLAGALAGCSHRPIQIGPIYVGPPTPVRPLVETPPPAVVPIPPTPRLKPGTGLVLEGARAAGDADAAWLAAGAQVDAAAQQSVAPQAAAKTGDGAMSGMPQPPQAAEAATASAGDDDPDHLVGLSEADAIRLLGAPKTRAETPPSRVWTYSSPGCDLRLFFYPEIGGTSYRTLTYEIDDRDPTDSNRRNCVGGLLKNHAS
jgi:hypothetical protein